MEILKVKLQENGYLVNDSIYVPNNESNRHYHLVQEWLKDNIAEPEFSDKELVEQALQKANELYEQKIASLTEGIPKSEINTWTKQESEARAYMLDNSSRTPLIDALSEARGVDKSYLATKIVEKADAYAVAVGKLTGERQRVEDESKISIL